MSNCAIFCVFQRYHKCIFQRKSWAIKILKKYCPTFCVHIPRNYNYMKGKKFVNQFVQVYLEIKNINISMCTFLCTHACAHKHTHTHAYIFLYL
jgi:hypothetical protein